MGFFLLGGLALLAFGLSSRSNRKEDTISENKEEEKIDKETELEREKKRQELFEQFNLYVQNDLKPKLKNYIWITVAEVIDVNEKYKDLFIAVKDKELTSEEGIKFVELYKKYFTKKDKLIGIEEQVLLINRKYINRELRKNKALFDNIDGKSLDKQQRLSAVIDDNKLIVAGAGAGKTLTIAGTVKYLIESKNIAPEDILLITYTKKAAGEMKKRIVEKSNIKVEVSTFHALGIKILTEVENKKQTILKDYSNKKFLDYLVNHENFLLKIMQYNLNYTKNNIEKDSAIEIQMKQTIEDKKLLTEIGEKNEELSDLTPEEIKRLKSIEKIDNFYKNRTLKDIELITYSDKIENRYSRKDLETLRAYFLKLFLKNKNGNYKQMSRKSMECCNLLNKIERDNEISRTFNYEIVKSHEEVLIANYLFRNNIKYRYEYPYEKDTATKEYRQYHPDFYLPDYKIYIEHFGINREGRTPQYTAEEEKIYLEGIKWKRKLHKKNNTKLIESYSYEFSEGKFPQNLHDRLKKAGVIFSPIPKYKLAKYAENIEMEVKKKNSYFDEFMKFIQLFKNNNFKYEYFDEILNSLINEPVSGLSSFNKNKEIFFIEIAKELYTLYTNFLKEEKSIDFADMINKAITKLPDYNKSYKYIVIDEYQDTSRVKCDLVVALKNKNKDCKVMVVGDDWQSIYRFTGNDLNLFVNFDQYLGAGLKINIENTYRNSQELIDIASKFVMQNDAQLKKDLKSKKHLYGHPIKAVEYSQSPGSYVKYDNYGNLNNVYTETDLHKYFDLIIEDINKRNPDAKNILVLGRYNADKYLLYDELEEFKTIDKKIKYKDYDFEFNFLSIHKSKGLEADEVILLMNDNKYMGFPSKIQDDPILRFVLSKPEPFPYAEERRLFYVATTRTRNRLYIVYNKKSPSEFISELKTNNAIEVLNLQHDNPVKQFDETIEKKPKKYNHNYIDILNNNYYEEQEAYVEECNEEIKIDKASIEPELQHSNILNIPNLKKYLEEKKPSYRPYEDVTLIFHILSVGQKATSRKNFITHMKKAGYEVRWKDTAKHVTFIAIDKNGEHKTYRSRLATMSRNFGIEELSKEFLENRFAQNAELYR